MVEGFPSKPLWSQQSLKPQTLTAATAADDKERKQRRRKTKKQTKKKERKNNVGACLHCVAVDGLRGGTSLGSGALAQGSGALAQGPGQKGEFRHDDMKSFGE